MRENICKLKFAYGTEIVRLAKTRELLRDQYNLGTWAAQWQMGLNADKYILERIIWLKYDYISSLSCLTVSFLNISFEVVGKHPFVSVRKDPDLRSEIWVQLYSLFGKIMQITDSAASFSFNQMQIFCIFYLLCATTILLFFIPCHIVIGLHRRGHPAFPHTAAAECSGVPASCGKPWPLPFCPCPLLGAAVPCCPWRGLSTALQGLGNACLASTQQLMLQRARSGQPLCAWHTTCWVCDLR